MFYYVLAGYIPYLVGETELNKEVKRSLSFFD